ncbi:MAG: ExbD/TolR family protein [Burkholderiales bacterium]|jgi:biopolymer transport protein ExbD|nr:biopolymer transporter ExbD [Nitrosomonadaceae bacterium]
MAMQIGSADAEDSLNSTINTTPLVDVMLVLLIIFLITIPVVTTSVKVQLPLEQNALQEAKPENIILSVNTQGQLFFYDALVKDSEDLKTKLRRARDAAKKADKPMPEIHIRGDVQTVYEPIGRAILAIQEVGLTKVSFLTDPTR